jgi:glycosyltransferase involved in cell wall biosynthesis
VNGLVGLVVCAKNEERSLPACLSSWSRALACGQGDIPVVVVLDDSSDGSAAVAAAHGARTVVSGGGKVAAQLAGLRALNEGRPASPGSSAGFAVFSDADVLVEPSMLVELCRAMADPGVHVAFPRKQPLPPARASRLARAVHRYNLRNGFSSRRTWFSGMVFAIRAADMVFPDARDIAARAARLPPDGFLRLGLPVRVDDVYLSQAVVAAHGITALREIPSTLWFRGPETLRGMYQKYRRMRAELERIRRLFPEFEAVRQDFGQRRYDRLLTATLPEWADVGLFEAAVLLCRAGYRLERACARHLPVGPVELWPSVEDTKLRPGDGIAGKG